MEKFGISKVKLVTGWSMGALQTFHWGAIFPDMVERILPFQGSAKCSRHNFVFLEGVKAALQADAAFMDGFYKEQPAKGLRAAARVYAGWGFSQTFYRVEADLKKMGYASLEDFLVGFWEGWLLSKDANNLLTMLWTWQNGDISNNPIYNGDINNDDISPATIAGAPNWKTYAEVLEANNVSWKAYQEDMGNIPTREAAACGKVRIFEILLRPPNWRPCETQRLRAAEQVVG